MIFNAWQRLSPTFRYSKKRPYKPTRPRGPVAEAQLRNGAAGCRAPAGARSLVRQSCADVIFCVSTILCLTRGDTPRILKLFRGTY